MLNKNLKNIFENQCTKAFTALLSFFFCRRNKCNISGFRLNYHSRHKLLLLNKIKVFVSVKVMNFYQCIFRRQNRRWISGWSFGFWWSPREVPSQAVQFRLRSSWRMERHIARPTFRKHHSLFNTLTILTQVLNLLFKNNWILFIKLNYILSKLLNFV